MASSAAKRKILEEAGFEKKGDKIKTLEFEYALAFEKNDIPAMSKLRDQILDEVGYEKKENKISPSFINDCFHANALGDGELYSKIHEGRYLYNNSIKDGWLVWGGHSWKQDIMRQALIAVDAVAQAYNVIYEKIPLENEKQRKSWKGRIDRLRNDSGREACLKFARTCSASLAISGDELDKKPWVLACANGVINLKTGDLRPGSPDDYIQTATNIIYPGYDAVPELFERTLLEALDDDHEMAGQ